MLLLGLDLGLCWVSVRVGFNVGLRMRLRLGLRIWPGLKICLM